MKIKIEFNLDNSAFYYEDESINLYAVSDALDNVARAIRDYHEEGNVQDRNGNIVGHWEIKE